MSDVIATKLVYVVLITADNVIARMPMPGFRFSYEIRRPVVWPKLQIGGVSPSTEDLRPKHRTYAFEDINESDSFIEYIYQERV